MGLIETHAANAIELASIEEQLGQSACRAVDVDECITWRTERQYYGANSIGLKWTIGNNENVFAPH